MDVKENFRFGVVDQDIDHAAGLGKPQEIHRAVDMNPETRGNGVGPAAGVQGGGEDPGVSGGVHVQVGRGVEGQAHGPSEITAVQRELRIQGQAGGIDVHEGRDRHRAERIEPHGHMGLDFQMVAVDGEGEAPLEFQHIAQHHASGHGQGEEGTGGDGLIDGSQAAVGIPNKGAGGVVDLEHLDGPLIGVGVEFQEKPAMKLDAGDAAALHGQVDPARHTVLKGHEIQGAGHGTQEGDLRTDRTDDVQPRSRSQGNLNEPGQVNHTTDDDFRMDGGRDVHFPRLAGIGLTVEARGGGKDREGGGIVRIKQGQEALGHGEGLFLQGGVEHHRDLARGTEDVDVGKTDVRRGANGKHARHTRVIPGFETGDHHQKALGLAVGDLGAAHTETQFGHGEDFKPLGIDFKEEPAVHFEQIGVHAGGPDFQLAHHLDGEGVGRQFEGPGGVGAVIPQPGKGQGFGLDAAGGVDLEGSLAEHEDAEGLQEAEIGFHGHHAPELGPLGGEVAHIQDETARRGAQGAQFVDGQLGGERQFQHLAGRIDFKGHAARGQKKGFVGESGGVQFKAPGQFDKKGLGLGNDNHGGRRRLTGIGVGLVVDVGHGVVPASCDEREGQNTGIKLAFKGVTEGVGNDGGIGLAEFVQGRLDLGLVAAVDRFEFLTFVGVHGGPDLGHSAGKIPEGGQAVNAGDPDVFAACAGQPEFGPGVQNGGLIKGRSAGGGEGDVDVTAAVQGFAVHVVTVHGIGR
ncbi:hypothetical protein [Desulfatiferula olefinivorans]